MSKSIAATVERNFVPIAGSLVLLFVGMAAARSMWDYYLWRTVVLGFAYTAILHIPFFIGLYWYRKNTLWPYRWVLLLPILLLIEFLRIDVTNYLIEMIR